ncbi:MAG: hypothetical protein AAF438_20040, partial [Pseudomonadota bacterium]
MLLVKLAVFLMVISAIESCYNRVTGRGYVPPTPAEQQAHQHQLAKAQAFKKAVDDRDYDTMKKLLEMGFDINGGVPTYNSYTNDFDLKGTFLGYVIKKWEFNNSHLYATHCKGCRKIDGTDLYAPESFFAFREARANLIIFLIENGATWHRVNMQKVFEAGYLPLITKWKDLGLDTTRYAWPLMMAGSYPTVALTNGDCLKRKKPRGCKRLNRQLVFDWLIQQPGQDYNVTNWKGQNPLMIGVMGARSEADALLRIEFWKKRGVSTCVRDKEQRSAQDLVLKRGWLKAYEAAACPQW